MSNEKVNLKIEKSASILPVANEIIRFRSENPGAKLNIADFAKRNSVSRAWIYKHFGSSQQQMIITSIEILGPFLIEPMRPTQVWKTDFKGWVKSFGESLELTLEQVYKFPHLFRFYIQARIENSEISEAIARYEYRFMMQIVRPHVEASGNTDFKVSVGLAEHLISVRIGLIFKWLTTLNEPQEKQRDSLRLCFTELSEKLTPES